MIMMMMMVGIVFLFGFNVIEVFFLEKKKLVDANLWIVFIILYVSNYYFTNNNNNLYRLID